MKLPDKTTITATRDAQVSLICDGQSRTVDLYSEEGIELISSLWIKLGAEYRMMYEPSWLGVPVIQFPTDMVMMQELIWKVRPDVIVECGLAHGGSALLYASICELIGKGRVVGVDVEVRPHNRVAIQSHPMSKRVEIIEGSSVDPATVQAVEDIVRRAKTVLIVLDSNHTGDHVAQELVTYHSMVSPGSYLVVMDGAQKDVWDIPRGKKEWRQDHPLLAVDAFLDSHPEFVPDDHFTRMHITSNPGGFLRRKTQEEMESE